METHFSPLNSEKTEVDTFLQGMLNWMRMCKICLFHCLHVCDRNIFLNILCYYWDKPAANMTKLQVSVVRSHFKSHHNLQRSPRWQVLLVDLTRGILGVALTCWTLLLGPWTRENVFYVTQAVFFSYLGESIWVHLLSKSCEQNMSKPK